ncbi:MAG: metallophosphoesterase [Clostridia bacterium]|nr:metallophosphoesterase [Clostridia bacterium]
MADIEEKRAEAEENLARRKRGAKREKGKQGKTGLGRRIMTIVLAVIVILAGYLTVSSIIGSNMLQKTFYQVKSNKVTDNIRIVCIADQHLKEFGNNNENLIREISKLKPDIIAIAGDMNIESQPDNYASIVDECKELNKVAPVYYSLGNHEIDAMLFSGSNIYKDIKAAGVKILNNEQETVTIGSTNVDVIGLTQRPDEFNKYGKEFFDKAMEENDNFKLVLNHYPENFMGTLDDYPIDLALAGHAHGGQIRLPWIGGLYAADQGFFPKLCDGYHEIGNSHLIITRGLSTSGWMPRINNRPEIAVIDLGWY